MPDTSTDNVITKPHCFDPATKVGAMVHLLRRARGATLVELQEETGWQAHSVRGAISGTLRKRHSLDVTTSQVKNRGRVYKLPKVGKGPKKAKR
jgi:hypothetical protein